MSTRVLFNGAVLVKPTGATRVDASRFAGSGLSGNGVLALIGEADAGEPNSINIFNSEAAARRYFRSGDLADAVGIAFNPANDARIPGGVSQVVCVKTNQSTQSTKTFQDATPANSLVLTSKEYGAHTTRISAQLADSGGGKIITIRQFEASKTTTETSGVLGAAGAFTIQYTGNGSASTMTISGTQLTTTVTGATDSSVALTLAFTNFPFVSDLIAFISAQPGYTCTAVSGVNPYVIPSAQLDQVTASDIKTAAVTSYAKLWALVDWVNSNSNIVTAARATGAVGAPAATTGQVFLTGGTRGISANTNWQNAFDALLSVHVNEVVPLCAQDLTNQGNGSTATFSSVVAMADAHVAYRSSTAGKSEAQGYVGMKGTKSAILAQAATLNSFNTCLSGQKLTVLDSTSTLRVLEEWSFAVAVAAMRAGAELGEPLTWKYIRASAITQDASWTPANDGVDLILGGVMYAEKTDKGIKIIKGITTYTRDDNSAYREESVVTGWKNVAYELRTHIEDLFTGRKLSVDNILGVKSEADAKLSKLRDAGQIVDSVDADGTVTRAYRNLTVSATDGAVYLDVEVSPVEGINFTLNSLYLVPATITASA